MSKYVNLVVFIDGTGNNAFKQPIEKQTNVARLKKACENVKLPSDVAKQTVFYRVGVGTRRWELMRGSAVGKKLIERLIVLLVVLLVLRNERVAFLAKLLALLLCLVVDELGDIRLHRLVDLHCYVPFVCIVVALRHLQRTNSSPLSKK